MIGTRILFALGRDRLFWSRTADVNAGGTPGVATLVTTAVAVVLAWLVAFRFVGVLEDRYRALRTGWAHAAHRYADAPFDREQQ